MLSLIIFGIILAVFIAILIMLYLEDYHNYEGKKSGYLLRFLRKDSKEKRKTLRLKTNLDMSYCLLDEKTTSNILQSKDISVGGAQIVLYDKLPKGTKIEVQIKMPFQETPIKTIAEIIWLREKLSVSLKQKKRVFFAGIKFVKINPQDEAKLLEYIYAISP